MKAFYEKVWEKMRKIPKGKVTTYKEIGKGLGSKAYRAIGNVCRNNPYAPEVPCHRVVKSDGKIGGFDGDTSGKKVSKKKNLLKKEGIIFNGSKIENFDKVLFKFKKK